MSKTDFAGVLVKDIIMGRLSLIIPVVFGILSRGFAVEIMDGVFVQGGSESLNPWEATVNLNS